MIRVVLLAVYVLAGAFVLALLGLGHWDPYVQFGATAGLMITATWILPGYFYRGDPLPTRRHRQPQ